MLLYLVYPKGGIADARVFPPLLVPLPGPQIWLVCHKTQQPELPGERTNILPVVPGTGPVVSLGSFRLWKLGSNESENKETG